MKNKTYENFPFWMILVSDAVVFGIYLIGAYIIFQLGLIWFLAYILFCLFQEIRVMRLSCVHCYYYGRLCGLGRGKLAGWLFKRGDPKQFLEKIITWKDLIPDLLVALVPFLAGIYLLFRGFNWLMLALVMILFLLGSAGNGFIRGNIVCKYCRQRELGCPAERLFSKK
jgi:hypothetical protein